MPSVPATVPSVSPISMPLRSTDSGEKYSAADRVRVLDDPHEWGAFSKQIEHQPDIWESSLVIEGMHCAACSITVEEALQKVPGVQRAQVSAASHRAKVVWSASSVQPSEWMEAVSRAGYQAVPANDTFASERRRLETRQALWRWLVAGLCMMQVMMYAYPAYIAHPGDLSAEMEQLLRWASWVLTLPVMLFSSGLFFKAALRDIGKGNISMDLPVALGIAITFTVSTVGTFEPNGVFGREVYFDSLTMFVFFLLTGRWLELRLRDRTAGALEALMNRLPDSVERQQPDGSFVRVAARRIVVGDVVRVFPGESFPADGCVQAGETSVDEALMTGESRPLPRSEGMSVLCGSHNLSATVLVRVEGVGASTRFAQIVALMDSASTSKPQSARVADRMAKPFLLAVLLAAAFACAWWWERDPGHALMVAVAVLIVTCPCALSLATPAAMLASAGAMAKAGVLVRRLQALEVLAHVSTVVFDKTGTLTSDTLVLNRTITRAGTTEAQALHLAYTLAQHSLHPLSRSIVAAVRANVAGVLPDTHVCNAVTEVPGQGVAGQLAIGGASDDELWLRLGSAEFCGLPTMESLHSQVYLADSQGWVATFEWGDSLRAEATQTVQMLRGQGLQMHILSGDSAAAVHEVARRVGIDHAQGGCAPKDKLQLLKALQLQGHKVVMVGDGLNDGPVLAAADVSIAFGQAVPLAQAQADFVILSEDLTLVASTIIRARKTLRVVHQNLWWALVYNAACIPLAIAGYLPAWLAGLGMAVSSLLVVVNALRLALPDRKEVGV